MINIIIIYDEELESIKVSGGAQPSDYRGSLKDWLDIHALKISQLQKDGTWDIRIPKNIWRTHIEGNKNLLDIFEIIAEICATDIQNPNPKSPACICPIECDCADPDNGLFSEHCPIHNEKPMPDPDCPYHQI